MLLENFLQLYFFTEMFYRDNNKMFYKDNVGRKIFAIFPSVQFHNGLLSETKQPLYYSKCARTHIHSTNNYPILHFISKLVEIILIMLRC